MASSQRTVVALPDIVRSLSVLSLTACTAATSPGRTVVFCQAGSLTVEETTYLGIELMNSENGTSGPCSGQYEDHSSYSLRPIRNASLVSIPWPMIAPIASSK